MLSRFDHFIRLILNHVSEGDPNLRAVSVETVGFIASTPEGKLALWKIGECVIYSSQWHCIIVSKHYSHNVIWCPPVSYSV